MKKVTDSDRVLVDVDKTGKTFFVWHKILKERENSEPIPCNYDKLPGMIRKLLIEAGRIETEE